MVKNIAKSSFEFLNSGFDQLRGVGEYFEKCLKNLALGDKIFDLLLVFPRDVKPVLFCPQISDIRGDSLVTLKLTVESYFAAKTSRQPHKFVCFNESGYVDLLFFKIYPGQIEKLSCGNEIAVCGILKKDLSGHAQIVHPEFLFEAKRIEEIPKSDLIYPLSGNLTQKFVRAKIYEILQFLNKNYDEEKAKNNDWVDKNLIKKMDWPLFLQALMAVHNFSGEYEGVINTTQDINSTINNNEIAIDGIVSKKSLVQALEEVEFESEQNSGSPNENIVTKAKERLKYDEFLAWQIAMNLVRKKTEKTKEKPEILQDLAEEFLTKIPFELTNAQKGAIEEIRQNILSSKTMSRLLQGDVGSGKTLVAIYACLLAVSCEKQACVIVPISILADQHFSYFSDLVKEIKVEKNSKKQKVEVEILSGKTRKKKRDRILERLKNGEIDILISTHAVIQPDVEFKNLTVAIIDEQHRFGVKQRLSLIEKGKDIDVLLMSATPIPRSLMMGMYGDMEVSVLDEKPKGRIEIESLVMSDKKAASVYDGVKRAMARGEKIYWICPLIEKNEENEEVLKAQNERGLVAAKEKCEELKKIFGDKKVSLIHGKMKELQKEKVMKEFKEGGDGFKDFNNEEFQGDKASSKLGLGSEISQKLDEQSHAQILVATTVIEVGVDVKEATIIVIENAENFGLSQLHQLRGRVGRSDKKSYCILLYGKKIGQKSKARLEIMKKSSDGFFIAEEDLKLRGGGELIGTRQSGDLGFRIANLQSDIDLLKVAAKNAKVILNEDPTLSDKKSLKYLGLLKLFSYDDCVRLVKA